MVYEVPLYWTPEIMILFDEFVSLRKRKRKPILTERGMKARIRKLEELSGTDMKLKRKIIEQTLDEEWLDFYALKDQQSSGKWENLL